MKSFYNRESQLFLCKNPGCKITKFNIGKLSGTAYQKALSVLREILQLPLRKLEYFLLTQNWQKLLTEKK
jgi:hypothetical protein